MRDSRDFIVGAAQKRAISILIGKTAARIGAVRVRECLRVGARDFREISDGRRINYHLLTSPRCENECGCLCKISSFFVIIAETKTSA